MNYLFFTIPAAIFVIDRITKWWALRVACEAPLKIYGDYISCIVTYNRGISWSMLTFEHTLGFALVTTLTIGMMLLLCHYIMERHRTGTLIIGELLVLGGGVANIYDRFIYGGVLDFILLQYGTWSFPVFNVADVAIVGGIGIMLYDALIRQ